MQLKNIENFYPLSPMQQGMLFHSLYEPEAGIYIVQTACHIRGDMNADAFERAWQQTVERHPILRTAFVWEDLDEPVQVVQRQVRITMDRHDWRALPASEQHTRLMALLQADRERGFDLAAAPLLRLALVQVGERAYEFIWSRHHILLDGWSEALVLEDVLACYEAICDGKEIPVARRRPYRDYIAWLRRQDLAQAEAFWRRSLGSFSAPTPLGLDAAPADLEEGYDELRIQFSMTGLQTLARRQRVTLNTLLQGAWVLLLSRYSGEEDIVFGVTVSGRPPDLAGSDVMVGLFINTLPVRVPARLGEPLLPWLKQLQAQQVEMRQYEYSPLVQVQGWSDVPRGMPLFESIMVFENFPMNAFLSKRNGRLAIQKMEFEQQTNYPLTVVIMPELTVLTLHISYDRRRFDAAVIARMLGHLQTLLEGMVAYPEHRLADLPIMTAAEREQLLVAWNDTATAYPRAERVHELFAAQAAHAPDAVAVVFDGQTTTDHRPPTTDHRPPTSGSPLHPFTPSPLHPFTDQQLTYRELNTRANQLAHYLGSLGVGPDVRVAICVERSLEQVIGVLGILKAGGAYVPLDPAYPPERIAFMLEDAQASVLITTTGATDKETRRQGDEALQEPRTKNQEPGDYEELKTQNSKLKTQNSSPCHLVTLSESWPAIALCAANDPVGASDPANLAYVIYTSGSTGSPKGVMTPQRAMGNLSAAFRDVLDLGPDDRFLMIPSLSFDASVGDIFPTLITGAALVLPRAVSELSGVDLLRLCEQQRVTIMDIPAAFWQQWVNDLAANWARDILAALKLIIVGGESVAGDRLRTWMQLTGGHVTFFGPYGPTEATVCTTFFKLAGGQAPPCDVARLPIGRPIGNAQVYVLDRFLNPVPIGAPGEVYIGGAGLARGYLNHPALTAERFVPNPFGGMEDAAPIPARPLRYACPPSPVPQLYKTGDLARWRADGNLEFLGRVDQQVKVRGFRIELGEIEVALRQHPAVQESAVVVREDGPGEKRLVAYVVQGSGVRGQGSEARSQESGVRSQEPTGSQAPDSLLHSAFSILHSDELRAFLRERLPDYMVPAAFVTLDALPVTANGKVDRRRLPAPDTARPTLDETFIAPESPVEAQLAAIWSQVLGVERVGIHDNFFALGGDSILSLQIITRANQAGLRLTPRLLFQHPTIAELAPAVGAQPAMQLDQGLVTGPVTLTPIQCWFFERDLADPQHWNQAMLLEARQPLDPALLERAVQHLLLHHDALRLRFTRGEDGWQQTNAGVEERPAFSLVNLPATTAAERAAAIEAAATRMQASLNLSEGPIMRVALLDPGEREPGRVLIVIHHLAVDGVSWRILLEDLQTAYGQLSRGEQVALPPKTTSFQQWAERLAAYARSQAIQKDADYWLAASWPALVLPRDLSGAETDNTEESARSVTAALSAGETQSLLTEVPAAYRTQINDALLTALAQACARWTGTPALLVDLEGHGREPLFEDADVSRTVGWCTTSFPVLLNVDTQHPDAALKAVKEQLRGVPNGGIGYGLLRYLSADQATRERLRALPQAEVSFNYLGQLDQALPEASLFGVARESSGPAHSPRARRSHLLEVNGFVAGGQLHLEWIYSEQAHRQATVERLAESFMEELRALIAHCLSPDAAGYTPSDFALAGLDQRQLDRLIGNDRQVEDLYPLSPAQQGMLFHSLYAPQSGVYVEQMSCLLGGELQAALLQRSVQYVVDQHPALRAAYVWDGLDEPLQLVRRRASVPFEQIDWRDAEPAVQRERLAALLQADRVRGFDLSAAPLMRLILIRMGERSYHFVWSFHHMLLDGWSGPRVLQQVFACYEAYRRGQEPRLEHSRPYRDYIAWLRGQDQARTEAFWRQMLAGITAPTALGVDRASAPSRERESSYAEQELRLSTETTAALQALARQQQLTLNTILEGVWALLLSCYSRESDVVFGITVSGRPAALSGVEAMVGMFINTLPVRAKVLPGERLLPWLKRLQDQQIELLQYEYSSLMQVQGWSELPRGVSLFDSILVFENYPVDDALHGQGGSLTVEGVHAFEQTNYPLTVMAAPGAALSLRISYDCDRFDDGTISRMAEHLQTLLEGVAADPQRRLADVPLMTDAERQQLVVEWNATAIDYPLESTLHRLIETQVARTPDAVAVVFDGPGVRGQEATALPPPAGGGTEGGPAASILSPQSLTYQELNRQANQLAHYLHALGVEVDTPVAVCLHRSLDLVVALLGVLKAGGAYVPLDPSYPQERLAFMLQDSQAAVLITTNDLRPQSKIQNPKSKIVHLDAERHLLARLRHENPRPTTRPDNLAYIIYTSGSTGRPKGAMNSHRAILNRLIWMQESYQLTSADVVLQKTPFSFDVSVWEFFWPLLTGARLILARPGGHQDSAYLVQLIAAERISTLHFVPAMLGVFLAEQNLERITSLVRVICSGEALPRELQTQFFTRLNAELHNLYGPTEAAIDVSAWPCAPSDPHRSVPLGRPIANTQLYVLDPRLQVVPIGVAGELYIGGVQLARGYWQRPDLTAERFLPNPFVQGMGDKRSAGGGLGWGMGNESSIPHPPSPIPRLYRTGDLARIDAEGVIEYLGRTDTQVKLRGFRIELGEVEAHLREHPSLREVAVVARQDATGASQLVAYVVPTTDHRPPTSEERANTPDSVLSPQSSVLRAFLSERLPAYMVPALFVELEALPLTPSGKVDRRALPAPDAARPALAEAYAAPQSQAEQTLAAIWTEVLGVRQVGVEDNFFALGGDSIRSIRVVALARARGLHLSLPLLFQHQTIHALTDALGLAEGTAGDAVSADALAAMEEPTSAPLSLVQPDDRAKLTEEVEDAYPLITLQSGMLFHSEFQPDSAVYHDIFTHHLRAPLELELLRQALQAVVAAHPVLRTAFDLTSYSQPLQLVYRQLAVELAVADLRALAPAEQERALAAWVAEEQQRGFVWSQPPLLRLQLHRRSQDSFQLTLSFHHAILDGWSVAALLTELFTRYFAALGANVTLPLPPQATYRDFVALERAALESVEARAYWTDLLRDASRMFLPRWPMERSEGEVRKVRTHPVPLAADVADGLRQLARTAAVPIKSVFLAAHLRVMSLLGGQNDVLTGLVANGRPELADGERVLGLFLNTLPLRLRLDGGSWRELIQAAFAAERELLPFRRFPLAEIQRLTGGQPLFEAAFNFVHFHVYEGLSGINGLEPLEGEFLEETNFTLVANFDLDPSASQVHMALEYDTTQLSVAQIEAIGGYYARTLAAMASAPDERYEACSLLSDAERQQLVVEWNATAIDYPLETTLHRLIETQVARTPDAVAVVFDASGVRGQGSGGYCPASPRRRGDRGGSGCLSPQSSVLDICRAEPPRQPARSLPARAGRRGGHPGRRLPASLARPGRRAPGRAQGRRRLRPARPLLPRRTVDLHARR